MLFAAIALGVVGLRAEEARIAQRIQKTQLELVNIRRMLWSVQLAIAEYKAPPRIEKEIERWALDMAAPAPRAPGRSGDREWARAR